LDLWCCVCGSVLLNFLYVRSLTQPCREREQPPMSPTSISLGIQWLSVGRAVVAAAGERTKHRHSFLSPTRRLRQRSYRCYCRRSAPTAKAHRLAVVLAHWNVAHSTAQRRASFSIRSGICGFGSALIHSQRSHITHPFPTSTNRSPIDGRTRTARRTGLRSFTRTAQ